MFACVAYMYAQGSLPVIVHCWLWVGWQFEAAHLFLIVYYSSGDWWEELGEEGLISRPKVNMLLDYETGIGASVNLGNSHDLCLEMKF